MRGHRTHNPWGGLAIYEEPRPGAFYVLGVDTSSGIRESIKEGDSSSACVIEVFSCRQVAEWHGFYDPTRWGMMVARLGWLYNSAWLGIETHPSAHGLTAFNACERYGYANLAMQERQDVITKAWSTRRGWTRTVGSTIVLLNRIRTALHEQCIIRSEGLIDELSAIRLEGDKIESSEHDDRVIAYGIALEVRDHVLKKGEIKPEAVRAESIEDIYWQRELAEDKEEAALEEATWNGI